LVVSNTVTATSTLRTRKNGANGGGAISISASTTGYFEDTSGTDAIMSTDYVNYQIVTGATGTSLTLNMLGVLGTVGVSSWPDECYAANVYMPLLREVSQ
jgi:hypothetical protein